MLLRDLTELDGVSGDEGEVREFIKKWAYNHVDKVSVDSMGNLICYKKGKIPGYKVMLSAHMDEVGFIVTGYKDGMIKFSCIGGIDERILPGNRVLVGDKKIPGVIGSKPIHLQDAAERKRNIQLKNMYIDIGTDKDEETEKLAPLGEYIAFYSKYTEFGENHIKAKALDDRVGCAILLETLLGEYDFDLYACFTVQEEVGLRGATVAAYTVNPDLAIVFEGTTCANIPGVEKHEYSTIMGQGPALTLMDRASYPNKGLVRFICNIAEKNKIPMQYKQTTTGGNDAGRIQLARGGVAVASVSVPCRYIHSPVSVINKKDFESCTSLAKAILNEFNTNKDLITAFRA